MLEDALVVKEALAFGLELFLQVFDFDLVLLGNVRYQHSVVRLAAILQEDLENFPDRCDDRVLAVAVRDKLLYHFVEPD